MTVLPEAILLVCVPLVPLMLALALMVWPAARMPSALAAWAAVPGLVAAAFVPPTSEVTLPWLLLGSTLGMDAVGRIFLLFSAALWMVAVLVVRRWALARRNLFLVFFLLVMSGSLGLTIAQDALSFYLCFSLMSFAAYGLVVHDRSQTSRHAGRVYVIFVLAGDMMIFGALVLMGHQSAGDLSFEALRHAVSPAPGRELAVALLVLGFGVKVGVIGLHVTLPLIYAAAPLPAGVVLAGVLINGGLLGWLRLLPVGLGALPGWGRILMAAGVLAAFAGAAAGVLQRRPAHVLGYSSISQMGIMTMGVGVAVGAPDPGGTVVAAVTFYALHHAFAKAALFLGMGIARHSGGSHPLLLALGLLLPALALAGAPLTTGMIGKEWLKETLSLAPDAWQPVLKALLPWMAVATTLVVARFLWLIWLLPRREKSVDGATIAAWAASVLLAGVGGWLMTHPSDLELWKPSVLWETTWPVALGAVLSVLAAVGPVRRRLPGAHLPPGDVLVPMSRLAARVIRAWRGLAQNVLPAARRRLRTAAGVVAGRPGWARAVDAAELFLLDWRTAGVLFVLTIVLIWALVTG